MWHSRVLGAWPGLRPLSRRNSSSPALGKKRSLSLPILGLWFWKVSAQCSGRGGGGGGGSVTPGDPSCTQPCSPALPRPSPHRPCWFLGARQGSEPPGKEETEALRVPPAAPSAPTSVKFSELTTTSVNVSWEAPQSPNGVLEGYRLVYEPCTPVDGEWPRAQQPRPASRPTLHGLPPGRGPSPAHTHSAWSRRLPADKLGPRPGPGEREVKGVACWRQSCNSRERVFKRALPRQSVDGSGGRGMRGRRESFKRENAPRWTGLSGP